MIRMLEMNLSVIIKIKIVLKTGENKKITKNRISVQFGRQKKINKIA